MLSLKTLIVYDTLYAQLCLKYVKKCDLISLFIFMYSQTSILSHILISKIKQNDAYVWIYHYYQTCLKIWYFFILSSHFWHQKSFKYSILRTEGVAAWCLKVNSTDFKNQALTLALRFRIALLMLKYRND